MSRWKDKRYKWRGEHLPAKELRWLNEETCYCNRCLKYHHTRTEMKRKDWTGKYSKIILAELEAQGRELPMSFFIDTIIANDEMLGKKAPLRSVVQSRLTRAIYRLEFEHKIYRAKNPCTGRVFFELAHQSESVTFEKALEEPKLEATVITCNNKPHQYTVDECLEQIVSQTETIEKQRKEIDELSADRYSMQRLAEQERKQGDVLRDIIATLGIQFDSLLDICKAHVDTTEKVKMLGYENMSPTYVALVVTTYCCEDFRTKMHSQDIVVKESVMLHDMNRIKKENK